jgi:transcriptional regulator with XRE-family HTH domain
MKPQKDARHQIRCVPTGKTDTRHDKLHHFQLLVQNLLVFLVYYRSIVIVLEYSKWVNTNTTIGGGLLGGIMNEKEICRLLGQAIKRFRGWKNWTQEYLAEKLDISANFLSNIENGKAWVSPKTVSRLAAVFNIRPHELFMPDYTYPAAVPVPAELLLRYSQETKESINTVLDELTNKYIKASTAN